MPEREIINLAVVESTNSVALEMGQKGAASGTVVTAQSQTEGRGRLHRSWLSPPGTGYYFSIILRPQLEPADLPKITLAAGVAASMAIELELGIAPLLKWPNDLLLEGKKFGGILSEAGESPLTVVGIGLNIQDPVEGFPGGLQDTATSLAKHTSTPVVREDLLAGIADELDRMVGLLEKGEFATVLELWKQRDGMRDRKLTWVTPKGEKVTGTSLGPDEDGMLRIRDNRGEIHTVISGDINLAGKSIQN